MQEQGYPGIDVIGDPVAETELLMSFSRAFRETINEIAAKPGDKEFCEGCKYCRYDVVIRNGEVEQRMWKVCWRNGYAVGHCPIGRWEEK